jgi:uncharacterized protein (TIGR03083 family)
MTAGAIDSLRADRAALLDICADLTAHEWDASSGCAGWRVQDVVAHMGALFWLAVDPSVLPDTTGVPTEQAQDLCVEARRSWSSAQVLDDYAGVSAKAIDAMAALETQDFELALGDLGTYHASLLPNAYTFDHYTHIRADLFAPRGPLSGPPPADELRLVPTIDWIEAAAPQQNAAALAGLAGSIELVVTGTAARTFTVGDGPVAARVECTAHDLVLWATQRATWDDVPVAATGDDRALAVARGLHVF